MRLRFQIPAILLAGCFSTVALAQGTADLRIPKIGTRAIPGEPDTSRILDKPYERLTEAEKDVVRGWYDNLPAGDEPPFPVNGMKEISENVAKVQQKAHVKGRFFAAAHVDARGHAATVSIYAIPDDRLKNVLAAILIETKYKPGRCSGKPCAMDFPIDVNFE